MGWPDTSVGREQVTFWAPGLPCQLQTPSSGVFSPFPASTLVEHEQCQGAGSLVCFYDLFAIKYP